MLGVVPCTLAAALDVEDAHIEGGDSEPVYEAAERSVQQCLEAGAGQIVALHYQLHVLCGHQRGVAPCSVHTTQDLFHNVQADGCDIASREPVEMLRM